MLRKKMMISSEKLLRLGINITFLVSLNKRCRGSVIYHFCECVIHKRCSGITVRLKYNSKFKYWTCPGQKRSEGVSRHGIEYPISCPISCGVDKFWTSFIFVALWELERVTVF